MSPLSPLPLALAAQLRVRPSVADARVFVDGRAVLLPAILPVGRHDIRVEASGYQPWTASVELSPGRREELVAVLELTPEHQKAVEAGKRRRRQQRWGAVGLGAGGLGLAGSALGIAVANRQRHDTWTTEDRALGLAWASGADATVLERQTRNDDREEVIHRMDRVTVGLAVASSLLVTASVTLLVQSLRRDQ